MNTENQKHIGTTITEDHWRDLKIICAHKGKTIANVIRNAIADFIKQNEEAKRYV